MRMLGLHLMFVVPFVLSIALCSGAQETKAAPKTAYSPVPVQAVREPNPVKPTPESIAEGKKVYGYDCASCHGTSGDAKTAAAKDLKVPNLTNPEVLKNRTDGEIFYIVKSGHSNMPPEGDRVTTEQIWDLVNYVRTLSKKQPADAKR